jgi:uracil phosphoribosyltransferase
MALTFRCPHCKIRLAVWFKNPIDGGPPHEEKRSDGTMWPLWQHTGFLNMFDHADNAFVSAFRFYKDDEHRIVDVHIEYIAAPSLNDRTLLLVDPMLATGESMELAWKAFLTKGKPAKLQMACVIASQQGVAHMAELFPGDDVTLWCAAIDPVLDEHKYIVPGLGDAGDLSFGEKL